MTARGFYRNPLRKVIAEFNANDGWLVLWPDRTVRAYAEPKEILASVRRRDRARAARSKNGVAMTEIEWRNIPDGFEPPK